MSEQLEFDSLPQSWRPSDPCYFENPVQYTAGIYSEVLDRDNPAHRHQWSDETFDLFFRIARETNSVAIYVFGTTDIRYAYNEAERKFGKPPEIKVVNPIALKRVKRIFH